MIYLLAGLFLFTRFIKLKSFMPLFMDEALYIRWLTEIKATGNWLLPLKEFSWAPLTTWISTLLSYLIKDNLLSLRLTALIFGGLSIVLAYQLVKLLFNQSVAFFASLFMILSPIILIHDRLGLRGDTAVTFTSLLLLYGLTKRLLKNQEKGALLIGLAIALGLLIKSTAWIFPLMTISVYLIFRPKITRTDFLGGLLAGSSLLFYLFTNSLSAFVNKSQVFLVDFSQTASFFKNNLIQVSQWSYQYLSLPVLLLIFIGAYFSYQKQRKAWLLLTSTILPVILFDLLFAKILFPRYLLFIAAYSLILASYGLTQIIKKLPQFLSLPLLILVFLPNLITDVAITQNIQAAQLPEIERWQYVTGWPSGYALSELVDYLKSNPPDILITEENNLIRGGLLYYWPEHFMQIIIMAEANTTDYQLQPDQSAYLALNVLESPPPQFKTELIQEFPRPTNKTKLRLYKILAVN